MARPKTAPCSVCPAISDDLYWIDAVVAGEPDLPVCRDCWERTTAAETRDGSRHDNYYQLAHTAARPRDLRS